MIEKVKPSFNGWTSNDDKDNGEETAGAICEGFLRDSGMHGINKLQKSSIRIWRRFIWGCAILGCSIYLIVTVTKEIQNYLKYPTTTSIDIDIVQELPFPAVTICNLSPYDKSKIKLDEKYLNYDVSVSYFWFWSRSINWSDPYYQQNGYFEPQTKEFLKHDISMDLEKVLTRCRFDNIELPCKNMFTQVMTSVGPCYTFNADGEVKTTMKGGEYNLNVEAFIDQLNYYYSFTIGSGVKVVIHDPSQKPDVQNEGLVVPPGALAYISVAREQHEYLAQPFQAFKDGYCLDLESPSYRNPLKYSNYSITACMDECFKGLAEKVINCTYSFFPDEGPFCSKYEYKMNIGQLISLYLDKDNVTTCTKQCPLPCKFTKYVSQISYSQYPSDFIGSEIRRLTGFPLTTEYMRNNYLNVRIYYEQLVTTTIRQAPVYSSWEQILANLGGQMGLFLGASILTLTELLEFALHIMFYFFKKSVQITKIKNVKGKPSNTADIQD